MLIKLNTPTKPVCIFVEHIAAIEDANYEQTVKSYVYTDSTETFAVTETLDEILVLINNAKP